MFIGAKVRLFWRRFTKDSLFWQPLNSERCTERCMVVVMRYALSSRFSVVEVGLLLIYFSCGM